MAITAQMPLGEVLENYPGAVEVLRSFDMKLGCGADMSDTIETAAKMQGVETNLLLKKLNDLKQDGNGSDRASVSLTDVAAKKMKELGIESKPGQGLRFGVRPGGCAGYSYTMEFDMPKNDDVIAQDRGIKIYMNKKEAGKVDGSTIDYIESLQASGFKVNNPNAKATCGCGKSASV
ncbi:MAG: iron-sulfur cluster assembly accessory protein [Candidatus Aenigmarchaeota archaeon]|nr:iron-sulfur cluster assembly accessory protein [Candidatus Aenigmarchaeota archaeon]